MTSSLYSLPSYEASHEFDKRGHRNHHLPLPAGPLPQAPPDNLNRHLQPPNNPQFNRGGPPPGLPAPPHAYPGDGPRHGGPGGPPYPPHNIPPVPFRAGAPHPMPGPMPFNPMNRSSVPYNGYRPPQPAPPHYNKAYHGHHPGPRNDRWEPRGGHNNSNQSRPLPLPAHLPPRPLAPLGTKDNDRDHGHYRGGGGGYNNQRRPDPPGAGGGGGELPDKPAGSALNYG